ncbi:hypothetical protein T09_1615 [Trichinella sp. T9]|nr:hypothetical protein T09_1615 [Trichinella sp. T9]
MPGTCTDTMDLLSFTCQVSQSLYLVNKPIATSRSHSRASSPTPALTTKLAIGQKSLKREEDADCVVN